jgi:hypothetical protein
MRGLRKYYKDLKIRQDIEAKNKKNTANQIITDELFANS